MLTPVTCATALAALLLASPLAFGTERPFTLGSGSEAAQAARLADAYVDWDQRFTEYRRSLARAMRQQHGGAETLARERARLGVLQTQADLLLDLAREHHGLAVRIRQAIGELGAIQQRYQGQAERWVPILAGHRCLLEVSGQPGERDMERVLVLLVLERLAGGVASGEELARDAARAEAALDAQRERMARQRRILLAEIERVREAVRGGDWQASGTT